MALWGFGNTAGGDKQPTWQKNRNTGRKARPAINDRNETYVGNQGWTQQVTKQGRTLEEVLCASSTDYRVAAGPGTGAANVTGVTWHTRTTAFGTNVYADVAFDQKVHVAGHGAGNRPYIEAANNSGGAFRIIWHWHDAGNGNGTNILTFSANAQGSGAAAHWSGNGEMMIKTGVITNHTHIKKVVDRAAVGSEAATLTATNVTTANVLVTGDVD